MLVLSSNTVLLAADNGYVYKCEDVTAGVTTLAAGLASSADLLRIKGNWQHQVIAGGTATGVILRSVDRGKNWSALTTYPSVDVFGAVEVMQTETIWVGTTSGYLYVSYDAGESWTEIVFNANGANPITDIQAATDEVMYFIYNTNTKHLSLIHI